LSPRPEEQERGRRRPGGAAAVAAGILTSRAAGLLRAAATSAAFGVGAHADVFQTALRAPNLLQNLLGEQALSASFIPVYSRLVERGEREAARRFAGAVFGLLVAVAGGLALLGVVAARPLVALFAAGYLRDAQAVAAGTTEVDRFELAVAAVRWIFPMTGLLVLSAWALGVLNSHRRFFLPYVAPVFWNAAIVAALVYASGGALVVGDLQGPGPTRLLFAACVGALIGGLLQLGVQLPGAWRALGGLRPSLSLRLPGVREALTAFGPAVAGRGVVQLSSYLDQLLASLLAVGAVSALGYGQMLYLLPVSLFGQAIAAAALPDLARASVREAQDEMASRSREALSRSALLTLPTTVAYLAFGAVAVAGVYRLLPGRFEGEDALLVAAVLACYAVGLPASTSSRVLQSTFFSLGDTKTPARVAAARVAIGVALGVPLMFWLDRWPVAALAPDAGPVGELRLGALGLALGATGGAWLERLLLGRALARRLSAYAPPRRLLAAALAAALAAVPPALWVAQAAAETHPSVRALAVFSTFATVDLGIILALRLHRLAGMRRDRHSP